MAKNQINMSSVFADNVGEISENTDTEVPRPRAPERVRRQSSLRIENNLSLFFTIQRLWRHDGMMASRAGADFYFCPIQASPG